MIIVSQGVNHFSTFLGLGGEGVGEKEEEVKECKWVRDELPGSLRN